MVIQKLNGFRATLFQWCPIFNYILIFSNFFSDKPCGAPGRPVVPLTGAPARTVVLLAACGGPDKYVVSLESSMVPMLRLWCPWQACGAPGHKGGS